MALDPAIIGLVLPAALLHAGWSALVLADVDRLVPFALIILTGAALGLVGAVALPLPATAAWKWLIASAAAHDALYFLLLRAYRQGVLDQALRLGRGPVPVLVAIFSALLIGESLFWRELFGVGLVSLGLVALVAGGRPRRPSRQTGLLALLVGLAIAAGTVLDGLGGRAAGSALAYVAWLALLQAPGVLLVAWLRRRHALWGELRQRWVRRVAAGLLAAAAYGVVVWALSVSPMAPVAALRETSVLFAAVIARLVLAEPFGWQRLAAAGVIVAGLVAMHVGPVEPCRLPAAAGPGASGALCFRYKHLS